MLDQDSPFKHKDSTLKTQKKRKFEENRVFEENLKNDDGKDSTELALEKMVFNDISSMIGNPLSDLEEAEDKITNELAPKRSKSRNKKKKKNSEMTDRLACEKLFKDHVFAEGEKDDEEIELEKLVFGGESDILEQLHRSAPKKQQIPSKSSYPEETPESVEELEEPAKSRKPAWDDEDDDQILVSEKAKSNKRCHRSIKERGSEKYKDLARERFVNITGNPEWASLDKKGKTADSDAESEEELLQTTGTYLKKSPSLPKTTIDIRKCSDLAESQSQKGLISTVEFHPYSKVAVVAGYNGTATFFEVDGKNNPKLSAIHFGRFPIGTAHFSTDGNELIVGSKDFGHFYTYDMICGKTRKVAYDRGMNQMNIKRFQMSPDGKFMAIHGRYGYIHLLSAKTKEWVHSLKMNGEIIASTFNKDGSKLFTHGDCGQVYIWDMNSRTCAHKFTDEGCLTGTSLALSPNDQYLACGSDSGVVNIYEKSSVVSSTNPKPLKALMNLTTEATHLKFNCTSELLAMVSSHKTNALKLVHFPSMSVFSNFPTREKKLGIVSSLDISLNSGYLTMGNSKGRVYLYRLRHFSNF